MRCPVISHKHCKRAPNNTGDILTSSHSAKDLAHPAVADLGVQVAQVDVVPTLLGAGLEAETNIAEVIGARVRP